jgi:uncharacterized protein
MEHTLLGRTGLRVSRTSFGVLPIQRTEKEEAAGILKKAFDAGINFYDTARAYTNSEEKLGYALSGVRDQIIIATKSTAKTKKKLFEDLETSLQNLKTDYVDILQLHNPQDLPDPGDPGSLYSGLKELQKSGKIRFIGVTNHSREKALQFLESGLYDTLQFPLCMISSEEDLAFIDLCKKENIGLIAMKALSGGLITNIPAAFAFLRQYKDVVPIWGIQRESELDQILGLEENPPELTHAMVREIEKDKQELCENFCRACGYCLPCPAEIPIPMAARMKLLLHRMPYEQFLTDEWKEKMSRIRDCTDCGHCTDNCPYGLDTPVLLKKNLAYYESFYEEHVG